MATTTLVLSTLKSCLDHASAASLVSLLPSLPLQSAPLTQKEGACEHLCHTSLLCSEPSRGSIWLRVKAKSLLGFWRPLITSQTSPCPHWPSFTLLQPHGLLPGPHTHWPLSYFRAFVLAVPSAQNAFPSSPQSSLFIIQVSAQASSERSSPTMQITPSFLRYHLI